MTLTLKTDNPVAEIGLYNQLKQIGYYTWQADRKLAKELLQKMHDQLKAHHADWADIAGIVVFEGPGSFTGLRIGLTTANTLAYGLDVPIVASQGENWIDDGLKQLQAGQNDRLVLPLYGAEANITLPKK